MKIQEIKTHYHNNRQTYPEPFRLRIQRALSRLGEDNYNAVTNNCEHFANWCVIGKHYSKQIGNMVENILESHTPQAKIIGHFASQHPKTVAVWAISALIIDSEETHHQSSSLSTLFD